MSRFLRSQGEGKRRSLVGGPFSCPLLLRSFEGPDVPSPCEERAGRKRLDLVAHPLKPTQILFTSTEIFVNERIKAGVAVETAVMDGVCDDYED
jgi:hypothetical protein